MTTVQPIEKDVPAQSKSSEAVTAQPSSDSGLDHMYKMNILNMDEVKTQALNDGYYLPGSINPMRQDCVTNQKAWHPTIAFNCLCCKPIFIPPRIATDKKPFTAESHLTGCARCEKYVNTAVSLKAGYRTYACCLPCCFCCLCWIPFVFKSRFHDTVHKCPRCDDPVGRYYKVCFNCPAFNFC